MLQSIQSFEHGFVSASNQNLAQLKFLICQKESQEETAGESEVSEDLQGVTAETI